MNNDLKLAKQPNRLNIRLYPHQLRSIYEMEKLEEQKSRNYDNVTLETTMGILGDIPGYGKSYSIVGMICNDKMPWIEDGDRDFKKVVVTPISNILSMKTETYYYKLDITILLVSTSLISQWQEYFKKTDLNIYTITKRKDFEILQNLVNEGEDLSDYYDVIIISCQRYNEFMKFTKEIFTTINENNEGKYVNIAYKRFIYDEPTSVHIPKMSTIVAGFYWFVSATYRELIDLRVNSNHFLSIFRGFKINGFTIDSFYKSVVKNPDDYVKKSFKMPETHYRLYKCINPGMLNVINQYIDKDVKEMIQAGNIKGAIDKLGGKKTDGNLVDIVTNKKKEELQRCEMEIAFYTNKPAHKKELDNWTKRKGELEKIIQDITDKFKDILKEDCPICRCELEKPIMSPCCNHIFCGNCIFSWVQQNMTCPLCRSELKMNELIYVNDGEKEEEKKEEEKKEEKDVDEKSLTRPETIIKIIKKRMHEDKDAKFIIFSSYNETFDIIKKYLLEAKLKVIELKGTKEQKDNSLRKYKEGEINIIFLNSNYNGAGINLEMTTDIILYHEMRDHIKEQTIGRAERIGRTKDLYVHQLE